MQVVSANQLTKRAILYYPTIDIPSDSWLRQAILYWDEINSIVPQSHDGEILSELSTDVRFLMSEGEFRPIKPEDLVFNEKNHNAFHQFREEIIGIISSDYYKIFIDRKYYQRQGPAPQAKYFSRIHSNKVSSAIFHYLEEQELARRTEDWRWFEIETNTALLYMSLLAKHLAELQENLTTIGTSLSIYEKMNFRRVTKKKGYPVVSLHLNKLLPTPLENVPLEKILDFKRRRKYELVRFRGVLCDYQNEISNVNSNEELRLLTANFIDKLILGINDLKVTMKEAKIGVKVRSIRSLINFQSAPSIVSASTIISAALNILPATIAIPVAIVSGAIELGLNYMENRIERSGNIRDSAFSYVYEAQKEGIIKPI